MCPSEVPHRRESYLTVRATVGSWGGCQRIQVNCRKRKDKYRSTVAIVAYVQIFVN